jgi:hypothetical protein
MPAKCVSSVSPRFHYRRVVFCFLPLAAILEFFRKTIFNKLCWDNWKYREEGEREKEERERMNE